MFCKELNELNRGLQLICSAIKKQRLFSLLEFFILSIYFYSYCWLSSLPLFSSRFTHSRSSQICRVPPSPQLLLPPLIPPLLPALLPLPLPPLLLLGISRVCAHLLLCESNKGPTRLSFPFSHCNNTRHYTGADAAMPWVVLLLVLGEVIIGKVYRKQNRRRETEKLTDSCCYCGLY